MSGDFIILLLSTLSISLIHTFTGPDHYLPFIALAKSGKWSLSKTMFWTVLCGIAHIGTSILIGVIGIAIGWTLAEGNRIDEIRGGWASWMLLLFGLGYTAWGFYNMKRNKLHKHFEVDEEQEIYVYEHRSGEAVLPDQKFKITPWVMFFIFALGPSEPILPILFYPAASQSTFEILILILVYGFASVFTMWLMVVLGYMGMRNIALPNMERYISLISGLVVLICGIGMVFLNW